MTNLTKLLIGLILVFTSVSVVFASSNMRLGNTAQTDSFKLYQAETTGEEVEGEEEKKKKKGEDEEEPDC